MTLHDIPAVNAILNGIASVLLVAAFVCIKTRRIRAHAYLMISAVVVSTAFLACYLTYHFQTKPRSIGLPAGTLKSSYLLMLFSHVFLAIVVLPMIVMALMCAYRRQWTRHHKIAQPTFWIWFYVSVTGVLIYLVLYHLVPAVYPAGALPANTGVLP